MLSGALMILIVLLNQSKVLAKSCRTPRGEEGKCIAIKECDGLYFFLASIPLPEAYGEYLKQSHCGFIGIIPKVCCSKDDLYSHIISRRVNTTQNIADRDDALPIIPPNILPKSNECGIYWSKNIIGYDSPKLDEFPWTASLIYKLPNQVSDYGCSGTLISKRYVLTAAHCLEGKSVDRLWKLVAVRLGKYNKNSHVDIPIEERMLHELYNPFDRNQAHDIALLRLNQDVNFDNYIRPVCLPLHNTEKTKTYIGEDLMMPSRKKTQENNYSIATSMKIKVQVISNYECKKMYHRAGVNISEKQLCAGGEKNKNSCYGDSGGSLVSISVNKYSRFYTAGIVSFGSEYCGKKGWSTVYTRVSEYLGWILIHMMP
ncbi:hypothetical protein WA026_002977 [Henosepilachna vigintioctopunctata]|uniref:CLIP domain-containing serine protease n=1 Tax=Henosepilachna vigintioctopunctata TaxID=420089 RepID=A0AAW1TNA5_9CUCU